MKVSSTCYIQSSNKTLMLHRIKKQNDVHQGKWVGLGGKVEAGETPEECIIREVKEESGLTVVNPQMKGILTFPKFKDGEDWYVFLFTASEYSGELVESGEGELAWIDNDKVFDLPLWEGDRLFLDWMHRYHFFSAKIVYEEGQLVHHQLVTYE